jgi:putative flavoprotein involved in K+ transport
MTTDPRSVAQAWISKFDQAIQTADSNAVAKLFLEDSYWRDLVTFTWNIKTMEGREAIREMLDATLSSARPHNWVITGEPSDDGRGVEAWFEFETVVARGEGVVRLHGDKCHMMFTAMTELKGHEEKRKTTRTNGINHRADRERVTWLEERRREIEGLGHTEQPYVAIIGGGQGGLSLGARLRQLGVPTIILERHERAGDAWRKRYRSLVLHDPIWYDHLPYLPFPEHWPVFTPKDKLGDWLEMYAKVMELNVWTSSTAKKATFDADRQEWTVEVERNGETILLNPKQLVLATGGTGPAKPVQFPGMEKFAGEILHSSQYQDGTPFTGRKVAVIGTGSSGHDISLDLWEAGADVTMVQRSSSTVVKIGTQMKLAMQIYSENAVAAGITAEKADLIAASIPNKVFTEIQKDITAKVREHDAEFYEKLEKAGFKLDFGEDESGMVMKAFRTASGYYIDVGASDLVISGDIKLKNGSVKELTERHIIFEDGTSLEADAIIASTGYRSMKDVVAQLISPDVAEAVGVSGGLGSGVKGEMRNLWKPTAQEAFWYMSGNLAMARFYSRFLALQLKARMEGIATPVFGEPG